jgi:NAD(P)-dependent dehydrogenase (short-subunit alcohol dehydrogenase family)
VCSATRNDRYACTKAAQVAMAKIAAIELAQHKIRVNVICPGWIESEIEENTWKRDLEQVDVQGEPPGGKIPLSGGKPGKAEGLAELVLFLASDRSAARHRHADLDRRRGVAASRLRPLGLASRGSDL